jgi:hypothetical protein
LKKLLASLHTNLAAFHAEAESHLAQIVDAPADYKYPQIPVAKDLAVRANEITEDLASVQAEDLEDILNRHANAAQQGHFQPLMLDVKKAYQAKEGLVGVYRGQVTTLANSITDYRQKLVAKSRINQLQEVLNPLRAVKKLAAWPDFAAKDLDAEPTLKAAADLVSRREAQREKEGADLLSATGVSFERWQVVFKAIGADTDPGLSTEEEQALLASGFLRKKLVVGS